MDRRDKRSNEADEEPDIGLEDGLGEEMGNTPLACATGKIRLHVETPLSAGTPLPLGPDQSRYLAAVMRVRVGDPVLVFNGRDGEWLAPVSEMTKRQVTLRPETLRRAQDQVPDLTLLFAPVKRARLDYLVQKATELGVRAIRPVITRRTMVSRVKDERLRANVIEAAEQCGRMSVPEVAEAVRFDALLEQWPNEAGLLFCDEAGPEEGAETALEALGAARADGRHAQAWGVLIGPEGGFDPEERERLARLPGSLRVGLGPRIMRADTAAVAALTLWQATLGDWDGTD